MLKGIVLDQPNETPLFIKAKYLKPNQRSIPLHYMHDIKASLYTNKELPLDNSNGKLTLTQELVDTYLKKTELIPEYWDNEGKKLIGQVWEPNFHRGRRAFSFLAINSGMVSASVLKEQLAQSSMMMAAYYGNGAQNLEPLITDGKNHIVNTIDEMRDQQAMLTLHAHLMSKHRVNLKKEITDMDRDQTNQVISDPTELVFDQKETSREIKKGNLSVRGIMTGWCSKLGVCQSNLMLMFRDCKECSDANHELDRIETNLQVLEDYIKERLEKGKSMYDPEILNTKERIDYLNEVKERELKNETYAK